MVPSLTWDASPCEAVLVRSASPVLDISLDWTEMSHICSVSVALHNVVRLEIVI
jgi:hypothetical protein